MIGLGGALTPAVRILLFANIGVFILQIFAPRFFLNWLALVPAFFVQGRIWQLATYMFLHGDIFHLFFNMLGLWVFGREVEERMGTRRFAYYYFFTGVGAGICALIFGWGLYVHVVGASGAVYGILLAFAMFFPNRPVTLLLFFILPVTMTARALVAVFGGLALLVALSSGGQGLGALAHLGGLLFGWLFMRLPALAAARRTFAGRRGVERRLRAFDRAESERRRLQAEIDELLEKISRKGMGSLTDGERSRLYEASERLKRL